MPHFLILLTALLSCALCFNMNNHVSYLSDRSMVHNYLVQVFQFYSPVTFLDATTHVDAGENATTIMIEAKFENDSLFITREIRNFFEMDGSTVITSCQTFTVTGEKGTGSLCNDYTVSALRGGDEELSFHHYRIYTAFVVTALFLVTIGLTCAVTGMCCSRMCSRKRKSVLNNEPMLCEN